MELDAIWLNRLIAVALIVLLVLIWKPLHKRFRGWAIIFASLGFGLGGFLALIARTPGEIFAAAFIIAGSIAALYGGRQKPIEQRKPTVTWMVVNGLWDRLAKAGVPADEIEQLKRLTPEERARLMKQLDYNGRPSPHDERWVRGSDGYYYLPEPMSPYGGQWVKSPGGIIEFAQWGGNPFTDPLYSHEFYNIWNFGKYDD